MPSLLVLQVIRLFVLAL